MLKKSITIIGGSTQDIMYYTDQALILDNKKDLLRKKLIAFEYGTKIHSDKVYFSYGGGGANTAVTLAALGLKTKLISSVGHDAVGHDLMANLRRRGVNVSAVQTRRQYRTALSLVVNVGASHEHVLFSYRGANDHLELGEKIIRQIKTNWIYLNSLAKISSPQLADFFQRAKARKIKLAWNPDARQLSWGLRRISKCLNKNLVLIVNRDEALGLVSSLGKIKIKNNIRFLFKKLHYGQYLTVITDGPRGAYVYDGSEIYFRAATNHKPISTLGAGDAFGSGFIGGLIRYHNNIKKALNLGILNSGLVVSKIGAQAGIVTKQYLKQHHL
ncbi:MAG: hypothetical protein C3F02_01000 [Parcubacteria group bacterium]|nr:MAG: hypothetical protein C3F02_01000 [Parcubacteria group bacterium]